MRSKGAEGAREMTHSVVSSPTLATLDDETRCLVRLAAVITAEGEQAIRAALIDAARRVNSVWVEELLLQTYLFAGFPRALNATREWRRVSGREAPSESASNVSERERLAMWREAGERTCARVYGESYRRLRHNIRDLHPELDDWMIVEGYGKVLSRPELDLPRRELCIVAACAAADQDRQLHSHLRGALNVGVSERAVDETIDELSAVLSASRQTAVRLLWARVKGK